MIEYILIFSVLLTTLIGARGEGLTWLVAYFYGKNYLIRETRNKSNKAKELKMILLFIVLISVCVFIAETRTATKDVAVGWLNINTFTSFISELGFNFTSICYVMMYVPKKLAYQFGYTYVQALFSLIPHTIDFLGVSSFFRSRLPMYKFGKLLHYDFNGTLDFGVGFSYNAEAFFNFSWFGVFMAIPLGKFLVKYEREDSDCSIKWNNYVKIIIFRNLIMFPRQMFFEFINSLLYQVLFIAGFIIIVKNITYNMRGDD